AIGKGTPVSGVTTDERGQVRGSLVDIGAFQTSLVVNSTSGSINSTPAQLSLAGAVSLGNEFGGPVAISFDPAVFTRGQTTTLQGSPLERTGPAALPIWSITGPENGLTISGGTLRVFQVDPGVTASIAKLAIRSGINDPGAGLLVRGTADVSLCAF